MKRDSDLRQYGAKGGCNAGMLRRLARPVGTAVVIVAAFSLLGGCAVHPRILYKDGLRFYHQGRLTEAIAALTEAHERALCCIHSVRPLICHRFTEPKLSEKCI